MPVLSLGAATFGGEGEFFRAFGGNSVYIDLYQLHGFDAMTPVEEMKSLAPPTSTGGLATSPIRLTTLWSAGTTSGN